MADLDWLITGATVYDGTDPQPRQVDVGVVGTTIAYVGGALGRSGAARVVDAAGLLLCPGFIDTHASTGLGYRFPNAGDNKLHQGVTTEVAGNCGTSTGPIGDRLVPTMQELAAQIGFAFDWRGLGEWFDGVEAYGLPFNVGTFVGHSTLRGGVGAGAEPPTPEMRAGMAELAEEGMAAGALGLSTGLVYAPGSFADTAEIIELARVAARHDGIYVSHMRNEREGLADSVAETIEIGRAAGLPALISHLKAAERPNWGTLPAVIAQVEEGRAAGARVTFEVYPYTAASTKLRTFIPTEAMADGVAGMVERLGDDSWRQRSVAWLRRRQTDFATMVLITESVPGAAGASIAELAGRAGRDPADTVVDVLLADPDAWIVYDCMDEADMEAAILWEHSIVCSDSWSYPVNAPHQIGQPHPRTYGAFTRFLERYALARPLLPLGEAIRKITSFPADWLGLSGRGRIAEGCFADLVLLDPANVRENATPANPRRFSSGTEYVWVNGTAMIEEGRLHDRKPGMIIRNTP